MVMGDRHFYLIAVFKVMHYMCTDRGDFRKWPLIQVYICLPIYPKSKMISVCSEFFLPLYTSLLKYKV
jgi:hypothetical protein